MTGIHTKTIAHGKNSEIAPSYVEKETCCSDISSLVENLDSETLWSLKEGKSTSLEDIACSTSSVELRNRLIGGIPDTLSVFSLKSRGPFYGFHYALMEIECVEVSDKIGTKHTLYNEEIGEHPSKKGRVSDSGGTVKGIVVEKVVDTPKVVGTKNVSSDPGGNTKATGMKFGGRLRYTVSCYFDDMDKIVGMSLALDMLTAILGDHEWHPTENGWWHYYTPDFYIG